MVGSKGNQKEEPQLLGGKGISKKRHPAALGLDGSLGDDVSAWNLEVRVSPGRPLVALEIDAWPVATGMEI